MAERKLPRGDLKGYRITKLGKRTYGSEVVENVDPRGRKYYWIGGAESKHEDIPGSDCNAVYGERLVSVTPLHLDLTEYKLLDAMRAWDVPGFDADERAT